jgi:hypothetical protein
MSKRLWLSVATYLGLCSSTYGNEHMALRDEKLTSIDVIRPSDPKPIEHSIPSSK